MERNSKRNQTLWKIFLPLQDEAFYEYNEALFCLKRDWTLSLREAAQRHCRLLRKSSSTSRRWTSLSSPASLSLERQLRHFSDSAFAEPNHRLRLYAARLCRSATLLPTLDPQPNLLKMLKIWYLNDTHQPFSMKPLCQIFLLRSRCWKRSSDFSGLNCGRIAQVHGLVSDGFHRCF